MTQEKPRSQQLGDMKTAQASVQSESVLGTVARTVGGLIGGVEGRVKQLNEAQLDAYRASRAAGHNPVKAAVDGFKRRFEVSWALDTENNKSYQASRAAGHNPARAFVEGFAADVSQGAQVAGAALKAGYDNARAPSVATPKIKGPGDL